MEPTRLASLKSVNPLRMICRLYILNWDGSMYNEICEFTFDDEKTGHGYYYRQPGRSRIRESASRKYSGGAKMLLMAYFRAGKLFSGYSALYNSISGGARLSGYDLCHG